VARIHVPYIESNPVAQDTRALKLRKGIKKKRNLEKLIDNVSEHDIWVSQGREPDAMRMGDQ
jgi:hypothetical protein